MASSLYIGKLLIGGTTVLVGTTGTVYLAKDQIWPKNELKELDFLPWECRSASNTRRACNLTKEELEKTPFTINNPTSITPDNKGKVATLGWEKIVKGAVPLDLEFTLKATVDSLEIKKPEANGEEKISIPKENGVKFQIKKTEKGYVFIESKLTVHDTKLIAEISKQNKLIVVTNGQETTDADATKKIKISITSSNTNADSGSTPKIGLKVEFSGKGESDEIVSGMKTWECTIEGTGAANKTLLTDETDKSDQVSKLKASFGIDKSPTNGSVDITEDNKKSMEKFIRKCVDSTKTQSNLDSNKKLSRTVERKLVATKTADKLQFENLEEFFNIS